MLIGLQCAPAVAQFNAARQQSWAQKVLGGSPSLPAYQELFAAGTYEDTTDISPVDGQKLMSCTPIEDTKIQNNTCVLSTRIHSFDSLA